MSNKIFWLLVAALLALGAAIGFMAPVSENAASRATAEIAPASDAWRAALPRDAAAATQAYMARLSPAARARSDAYFEGGYWLLVVTLLVNLASLWVLLASGVLVRARDAVDRRLRRAWLSNMLVGMLFVILLSAFTSPLDVYQGFYREHLYGLANQSFGAWLGEQIQATIISVVIGGLFFALIYMAVRRASRTWWIWGAGLGVVFLMIMMLLGPVYIDPLFNTYKPLADERVKTPILVMAHANGVPVDNVYRFDASKQSNRISANVSGIFGTAAVRLNDNLLKRTSLPEIKGVMGHEIGHYVLNHAYKFLIVFGLILVVGFVFLKWSLAAALRRWGARFCIRDEADPAGIPLAIGIFALYMSAMTPIMNTTIRVAEIEADAFGLNASQEPDGFAEVDLKLSEYRKVDPGPIEEFLFYDHPSPRSRIFSAMRWKEAYAK